MKNLPLGLYTFERLITKNFLYIDKTEQIYQLIEPEVGYYFLSRPVSDEASYVYIPFSTQRQTNRDGRGGL